MSFHPRYAEIGPALEEVLDPNIKDCYFRARWNEEDYKKGMKSFEETFDRYLAAQAAESTAATITPSQLAETIEPEPAVESTRRYGSSYLADTVNSIQRLERATAHPRDELKGYPSSPVEQTDNVLHWWGILYPWDFEEADRCCGLAQGLLDLCVLAWLRAWWICVGVKQVTDKKSMPLLPRWRGNACKSRDFGSV
ncbi:hypothetical protein C8R44DRAFT_751475 [Mycena epipterygia]|nr:hypothetical protein C8R44DRAFT_751475 [Mycena epipterygia]